MKEIQLTQGQVALVDDEDFEYLNQWKWYAHKHRNTFYARRMAPKFNGKRYMISMHHEILGYPPQGFITDHCSGRGLDNQRKNLRFVTNRENCQNRHIKIKVSQYPGVTLDKRDGIWFSRIQVNGKTKHLGRFKSELQAFQAYQQAVESLGETVIDISHDTAIQQRSIL